ncbi:porin [uncultured Marinobacter sp.]|uniref:porin n=1 Tax=uncultured Marinobacter sp. TaxID=187379 RepID=UPI0030D7A0EE
MLALAVGALVAAPSVALADKGPTVYGKINASYENVDDGANDAWELRSNASRIGVKGDLDLDFQNVKAIYQAEFQVDIDDGDRGGDNNSPFSQRNIFGGFQHDQAGTLRAGKFDTPFKVSQGKIDQFGDLGGDINGIVGGDERASNIIQYSTPKLADAVTINLAFIPGEDSGTDRDGVADSISSSLVFDNGMLYASVGYDSEMEAELYDAGEMLVDAFHVAAKLSMNQFELGALYQVSENSEAIAGGDAEDSTYILSGAFKMDRWKFKAQYGMTDLDRSNDDLTLMAIGADYKVASNSKMFAYYANIEADVDSQDDTQFGIGFEHNFSM